MYGWETFVSCWRLRIDIRIIFAQSAKGSMNIWGRVIKSAERERERERENASFLISYSLNSVELLNAEQ